jgi:hypothetical protein
VKAFSSWQATTFGTRLGLYFYGGLIDWFCCMLLCGCGELKAREDAVLLLALGRLLLTKQEKNQAKMTTNYEQTACIFRS